MIDVGEKVRRIRYGAESARDQLKAMRARILDAFGDVAAIFFAADGALKPEAVRWLNRLARNNFVDSSAFDPDPRIHAKNEGRRELVLEILGSLRLDTAKLARLSRQLKEVDDE